MKVFVASPQSADLGVSINYVLDVFGNVLFTHMLRGVVAQVPIVILNIPDLNGQRIAAFFDRVAPERAPKMIMTPRNSLDDPPDKAITLNYKAKVVVSTPFPEKFYPEEENLVKRLREANSIDLVDLQMRNYFTKTDRIRQIYATSPPKNRNDVKWLVNAIQQDFRKSPVSKDFIHFVITT